MLTMLFSGNTEKAEGRHEHHQLPPHENVSQGRGSQEEELRCRVSCAQVVEVDNKWNTGTRVAWMLGSL